MPVVIFRIRPKFRAVDALGLICQCLTTNLEFQGRQKHDGKSTVLNLCVDAVWKVTSDKHAIKFRGRCHGYVFILASYKESTFITGY